MTSHPDLLESLSDQVAQPDAAVLLLTGPAGAGKRILAESLAARVLDTPATRVRSHPDAHVLEPDPEARTRTVPVARVREVTAALFMAPSRGERRILIVNDMEALNEEGAAALLKTLEEPPHGTLALPIADSPGAAPATLRSRSRLVRVPPPDPGTALTSLRAARPDLPAEDAHALSLLSRHLPGRAVALADADGAGAYRELLAAVAPVARGGRVDLSRARAFADARAANSARDVLPATLIERIARTAAGEQPEEAVPGEGDILRGLAATRTPGAWADLRISAEERARRAADLNLPPDGPAAALLREMGAPIGR